MNDLAQRKPRRRDRTVVSSGVWAAGSVEGLDAVAQLEAPQSPAGQLLKKHPVDPAGCAAGRGTGAL
jgi:hypothetical protein